MKNKTFYAKMILPEFLKFFFFETGGVIFSDRGFQKKREAECYVNLLAVKQLYYFGLYGEDLYPNFNRYLNQILLGQAGQIPLQN